MKNKVHLLMRAGLAAAMCLSLFMPVAQARLHGAAAHQKPPAQPKTNTWGAAQWWPESIDEGLDIEETMYIFSGPLLPRSWTDTIVIHHVGTLQLIHQIVKMGLLSKLCNSCITPPIFRICYINGYFWKYE